MNRFVSDNNTIVMIENKGTESWSQDQFLHASPKYASAVSNLKPERCHSNNAALPPNVVATSNNTLISLQSSDLCDQYRYSENPHAATAASFYPSGHGVAMSSVVDEPSSENLGQHKGTTARSGNYAVSNGMREIRVTSNNSSGGHSLTSMVSLLEEQWNQGSQFLMLQGKKYNSKLSCLLHRSIKTHLSILPGSFVFILANKAFKKQSFCSGSLETEKCLLEN